MDENEGGSVFASVVSDSEWQDVPSDIAKKLTKFVEEKVEEVFTLKALLATNQSDTGNAYFNFNIQFVGIFD